MLPELNPTGSIVEFSSPESLNQQTKGINPIPLEGGDSKFDALIRLSHCIFGPSYITPRSRASKISSRKNASTWMYSTRGAERASKL